MENDTKELAELKAVYDELWLDARTLIKDMRNSITIYLYAGMLTFTVSIVDALNTLTNFLVILSGASNFLTWVNAVFGTLGMVVTFGFGVVLLRWYLKLNRKYSKLIQLEKKIGDK